MRTLCVAFVVTCAAALGTWHLVSADENPAARGADTASRPAVKLLCGFEPDEMVRFGGKGFEAKPSDNLFNAKPPAAPISGVVVSKTGAWFYATEETAPLR